MRWGVAARIIGVIIIFIFAAIAAFFAERIQRQRLQQQQNAHQPVQQSQPVQPSRSDRLPANITLDNLRAFFKDRTTPEGERLAAPYINKWVKIETRVDNTQLRGIFGHDLANRCAVFSFGRNPSSTTICLFENKWKDRIEVLRKGDIITVEGQIWLVDVYIVELDNCELVDVRSG
jgi:hypothetical protein